ncbi:MAG: addiction module protein [Tepidisphaeraceae bacterium]|jgi:putative addiction module component (TIGR02574 family)
MSMTKEQVLREAMALASGDREAIADELFMSLDEDDGQTLRAIWLAEAKRRDADYAAGRIKASSVEEAVHRVLARSRP